MSEYIYANTTIYPHTRIEDWPAPDRATAQRWVDECHARGIEAYIIDKWNGFEAHIIVRVGIVVTHG